KAMSLETSRGLFIGILAAISALFLVRADYRYFAKHRFSTARNVKGRQRPQSATGDHPLVGWGRNTNRRKTYRSGSTSETASRDAASARPDYPPGDASRFTPVGGPPFRVALGSGEYSVGNWVPTGH